MIINNIVLVSATLAGTVLLAKKQGFYEPDIKKKEEEQKKSKQKC